MLMVAFLRWWYGPGWQETGSQIMVRAHTIYLDFSVPILLRTLMAPWRRIVSSNEGALSQKMRAMLDNVISRFVGLMVRLMALLAAGIAISLTFVVGGLIYVLWPIMPPLGLALIVLGLVL